MEIAGQARKPSTMETFVDQINDFESKWHNLVPPAIRSKGVNWVKFEKTVFSSPKSPEVGGNGGQRPHKDPKLHFI